jgi:hypothetical protein
MTAKPSGIGHKLRQAGGVFALLGVQLIVFVVSEQVSVSADLSEHGRVLVSATERLSNFVFLVSSIAACVAWILDKRRVIDIAVMLYASCATLALVDNVAALVLRAIERKGEPLYMLWDVFAVYAMIIVVFAAWYSIVDRLVQGAAFVFPKSDQPDAPERTPNALDYIFIAFNATLTFGPTTEAAVAREAKVVMMLQAAISLVVVTVLLARAVGG